jgi:site-specific DNA-methyltransferase (adenine-specific)
MPLVGQIYRSDRATLIQGDCLEVLRSLPDSSVDSVITDPPFLTQNLHLYGDIASMLPRVLKTGGSLLSLVPHFAFPRVLADVGQYLKYRWTMCMWQGGGSHARMAMGIEVLWHPLVWWVNKSWPKGRGFVRDAFESPGRSKELHQWQKPLEWAAFCMKCVPLGGTVLDPFMGSGTVGVAAVQTDRYFLGVDIDPVCCTIARERLAKTEVVKVCH